MKGLEKIEVELSDIILVSWKGRVEERIEAIDALFCENVVGRVFLDDIAFEVDIWDAW